MVPLRHSQAAYTCLAGREIARDETLKRPESCAPSLTRAVAGTMPVPPSACAGCGTTEAPLSSCAACLSVGYCSKACQAEHWAAGHKAECRRAAMAGIDEALQALGGSTGLRELTSQIGRGLFPKTVAFALDKVGVVPGRWVAVVVVMGEMMTDGGGGGRSRTVTTRRGRR